jgi:hypothetical protein
MTAVAHAPLRLVTCRQGCPADSRRAHHDRLLRVDRDPDALLELVELAVTWHELDYSHETLVPPSEWSAFVERHDWERPDRAGAAFMLALDIVHRGARRARPARSGPATMFDVVPG